MLLSLYLGNYLLSDFWNTILESLRINNSEEIVLYFRNILLEPQRTSFLEYSVNYKATNKGQILQL